MVFQITLEGYASVDREVKEGKSSGRIFVPKAWIGKKVKVVLIEPILPSTEMIK
jgi:putative transposon-encoded protein